MKLLYSSVILLITLVVAVQNFKLPKPVHHRLPSTFCSSECEFKYFSKIVMQSRMWASMFLPLPTSHTEWNDTCSRTTEFLNCSKTATIGCRKGRPPMVRLAQIRDAYGYLCNEGKQEFLDVLPCLGENYDHKDTEECVRQRESKVRRGPDGDFCMEIKNVHDCAGENAMKKCGIEASEFMSNYIEKTHQGLKEVINCDKLKNNKHMMG